MKWLNSLRKKAKALKSEINVLAYAYRDQRTPLLPKFLIGLTIAYMLSPIDLIPDFIPILGLLDDLVIVPALISLSINKIPIDVLNDARERAAKGKLKPGIFAWIIASLIAALWLVSLYYAVMYFVGRK